jgi:hypothetical protein
MRKEKQKSATVQKELWRGIHEFLAERMDVKALASYEK